MKKIDIEKIVKEVLRENQIPEATSAGSGSLKLYVWEDLVETAYNSMICVLAQNLGQAYTIIKMRLSKGEEALEQEDIAKILTTKPTKILTSPDVVYLLGH